MSARTVSVSLPEDFVKMIDRAARKEQRTRSELVRRALEAYFGEGDSDPKWREALVVELLRSAAITQGQATSLLGLTRWEVIDLMAAHEVPMADGDAESLRRELELLSTGSGVRV